MNATLNQTKIVVAGASGFIGRALPDTLADDSDLIGLSRDPSSARRTSGDVAYRWRKCDLFSRIQTARALRGADFAVYLVHSLRPSARLTQGKAGDLDLICADNFARAARRNGVEHIVYVSRIACAERGGSAYFQSRLEVEQTLRGYGTPVTALRTALVIGPGGSHTRILSRLVERLPLMALPRWADTRLAPIARGDLVDLIAHVLPRPGRTDDAYEVGGPEVVTFRRLLAWTAHFEGRRVRIVPVPFTAPRLSTAWVSLWTGQSRAVVRPFVESLTADAAPFDRRLFEAAGIEPRPIRSALEEALETDQRSLTAPNEVGDADESALLRHPDANEVRAVHRLTLPPGRDARWIAREYARWVPAFFGPVIDVECDPDGTLRFRPGPLTRPLLVLEHDDVSDSDRQLYWIRGGLLALRHRHARLEFRRILGGRSVLAAIHEFRPALPWLLYLATQAGIHHFVMSAFNRHLKRFSREDEARAEK